MSDNEVKNIKQAQDKKVWIAIQEGFSGTEIKVCTTLTGLAESIGSSYDRAKNRALWNGQQFWIGVGRGNGKILWCCCRMTVQKSKNKRKREIYNFKKVSTIHG